MILVRLGLASCLAACGGVVQNPDSPFTATSMDSSGPPTLRVENRSDITANVDCTGASNQSIVVPPGEQREVQIPAGTYSCILHGGDALPYTWSETYAEDTRYTFEAATKSQSSM
jgi:hypothetical protein